MAEPIVVSTLKKKRSEIAGHIDGLNEQLEKARADLVHVDATLRIVGFEGSLSEIPSKRKARSDRLFARNEVQRFLFDQLRQEPDGLDTSELVRRMLDTKSWPHTDSALFNRIRQRVSGVLNKWADRGKVQRAGLTGNTRIWRIAP